MKLVVSRLFFALNLKVECEVIYLLSLGRLNFELKTLYKMEKLVDTYGKGNMIHYA